MNSLSVSLKVVAFRLIFYIVSQERPWCVDTLSILIDTMGRIILTLIFMIYYLAVDQWRS